MSHSNKLLMVALLISAGACGANSTESDPDSGPRQTDARSPDGKGDSRSCSSDAASTKVHDKCTKMDVAGGEGTCNCISMGWAWNGTTCTKLPDGLCSCVGADCDKLAKSEAECLSQHASCKAPANCGSQALYARTHAACTKMDVAGGEGTCNCMSMGWTWNGTACTKLPDGLCSCVGADCDKLAKSEAECLSQHASCKAPANCGSQALYARTHAACTKMDVAGGEGTCNCMSMGWTWNGTACTKLPDGLCSCVGADCDKLAKSEAECLSQHASCTTPGT